MGSSRLPGKMTELIGGHSLLAWVVQRAKQAERVDKWVVATTDQTLDDVLAELALDLGAECIRGPEEDVLARFKLALDAFPGERVVRLTGDNPMVDGALVDRCLEQLEKSGADIVDTAREGHYPVGLSVEVLRADVLERAAHEAVSPEEREHVTLFAYLHPERFRHVSLPRATDDHHLRVTVDTEEDLAMMRKLIERFNLSSDTDGETMVDLLRSSPDINQMNGMIQQVKPKVS